MAQKSSIRKLLEKIRYYRVDTKNKKQWIGIRDTLLGWLLIGLSLVFFPIHPANLLDTTFSASILYISATLFSVLLGIIVGWSNKLSVRKTLSSLQIRISNETHVTKTHLTKKQRSRIIYLRGLLATTNFIALQVSRSYFDAIDNSSIFSADAVAFVILASFVFKERLNIIEWSSVIFISCVIAYIFIFDQTSETPFEGLISWSTAIYSAATFSIVFFITSTIIGHDPPLRVLFHQNLAGVAISIIALLIAWFTFILSGRGHASIDTPQLINAIVSGAIYSAALYLFLRAFLYTDPIIIAVLGYSLGLFVFVFQFFAGEPILLRDVISALLIALGCSGLLRQEILKHKKHTCLSSKNKR